MVKVWADVAWNDYCQFFELNQKKLIKMVHELLKDIERNGADKLYIVQCGTHYHQEK